MRGMVPLRVVQSNIVTTNWGNAPSFAVAEGAFALLMAMLKNLRGHIVEKQAGHWSELPAGAASRNGSLRNLNIGIYGLGYIGRTFCDMLRPFRPIVRAYDPFVEDWPADIARADSLEALFAGAHAVVIHAGLTDQTKGSVTAPLLKLLPDHAILINTARGDIVDQEALFAELSTGRLRAGLDVLTGDDKLPLDHPARHWPNVILTAHQVSGARWPHNPQDPNAPLSIHHEICLDNLRRFAAGEPLRFPIDETRYSRMS
jgi:phosphoglycerate dehydrogenase-like enzyme